MELTARILRIRQETPSVKSFLLEVDEAFTFLPGQWIDLYVEPRDGETAVGGYTLVSSPTVKGRIELAIKREGGGQAALYLHERAKVGDLFRINGPGGDFYFREGMSDSLVLIAGGIGINPLMSMVRYVDAQRLAVQTTFIYTAKRPSELLFHDELHAIAKRNPLLRCVFTVTEPGTEPWSGHVGRIGEGLLRQALPKRKSLYYLCGPPGMPTALARMLQHLGIPPQSIRFEEW